MQSLNFSGRKIFEFFDGLVTKFCKIGERILKLSER